MRKLAEKCDGSRKGDCSLNPASPQLLAARLQHTLSALRPPLAKLRETSESQVTPAISVTNLQHTLSALKPALETFRRQGNSADIWTIAGIGHDEVRNARVLAWLLDPYGSHGVGDSYLVELWRRLDGEKKFGFPMTALERVARENYPLGNGENRIDIEITGHHFILFIEVKIYAGETKSGQLQLYSKLAAEKAKSLHKPNWAILYLSEDEIGGIQNCVQFRWKDIARVIRSHHRGKDQTSFSARLALHFAQHVSQFH